MAVRCTPAQVLHVSNLRLALSFYFLPSPPSAFRFVLCSLLHLAVPCILLRTARGKRKNILGMTSGLDTTEAAGMQNGRSRPTQKYA